MWVHCITLYYIVLYIVRNFYYILPWVAEGWTLVREMLTVKENIQEMLDTPPKVRVPLILSIISSSSVIIITLHKKLGSAG